MTRRAAPVRPVLVVASDALADAGCRLPFAVIPGTGSRRHLVQNALSLLVSPDAPDFIRGLFFTAPRHAAPRRPDVALADTLSFGHLYVYICIFTYTYKYMYRTVRDRLIGRFVSVSARKRERRETMTSALTPH